MRALGPLELASARFLVAGAIALAWLASAAPCRRADALRFLLCGLSASRSTTAVNQGERSVARRGGVIVNIAPILTGFSPRRSARTFKRGLGGRAVSFAGVGLIALGQPDSLAFDAARSWCRAPCARRLFVVSARWWRLWPSLDRLYADRRALFLLRSCRGAAASGRAGGGVDRTVVALASFPGDGYGPGPTRSALRRGAPPISLSRPRSPR